MRFRITVFLLLANIVLFLLIWHLESPRVSEKVGSGRSVAFTELEISGKNLDKPRILKFENNKWRIVSPIDWNANLFAVNRIRNQIEFLDRETSFSVDEIKSRGHTLADYGLDDPVFTLKYGTPASENTLKIGKSAPSGDRVYMLDEKGDKVIVVDKEFVDGLIVDMERLRSQSVFDIPRFEVSAFSVRIPVGDISSPEKAGFRRIGLVKDGGKWKFETPITASADPREVDAFLNEMCQMSARSFGRESGDESGFDVSALPVSITLEGTNRRQILLVGARTKDGKRFYAKLDGNPTIFTIDAERFENLPNLQTLLRDKNMMAFNSADTVGVDISAGPDALSLRKIKNGMWDVIGKAKNGDSITASADLSLVASLLSKLEGTSARQFVSDVAPSAEALERYGLGRGSLHIVATQADQSTRGIKIGSSYKNGGETLYYASVDGNPAVYGISRELCGLASVDFSRYRSRILCSMPEKAVPLKLVIADLDSGGVLFEITAAGGSFDSALKSLSPRGAEAAKVLLSSAERFVVDSYLDSPFDKSFALAGGKKEPWAYSMEIFYELPGTAANVAESRKWLFTRRLSGSLQYGGSENPPAEFSLPQNFVDALFEFTQQRNPPESLNNAAPVAPAGR